MMKLKEEPIDKLFSTGLANLNEAPSAEAWNSIESKLPKNNLKNYWIAASIVAILMVSAIAWNNILSKSNTFTYEMANSPIEATYPQIEQTQLPIIIHSTTIVYIEKQAKPNLNNNEESISNPKVSTVAKAAFDIAPLSNKYALDTQIGNASSVQLVYNENEPITIIYKKGDPKHPRLAKAASFLKQVGEGDRPLIDFEKISTGLIARRENFNNSNK